MTYKTILELGFERLEMTDNVHFEYYGWHSFLLSYKLGKRHELIWEPTEPTKVRLNRYKPDGYNIIGKWEIYDLETVQELVRMFGKTN
jgi:hypothetical protein